MIPFDSLASRVLRRVRSGGRYYRKSGVDKHYTGNLFDRFVGLELVLPHVRGATVLDFGCCEGLIAYEFARAGCGLVHGFDIDEPLMVFARQLFKNVPVKSAFVQQDLSIPFSRFTRKHAALLLPRYDVVLFLGIYHHLEKQMSAPALAGVVNGLLERTGAYFVARTNRLPAFEALILDAGFEVVGESPGRTEAGLLKVYRRVQGR